MKVGRVLILVLSMAALAMMARADGVTDPQIKLGPSGKSTHTTDGATAADPIFVADATGTSNWFLDNPSIAANGAVYFEVVPFQGESFAQFLSESWVCVPEAPVATGCGFLAGLQGLLSNAVAQGFTYLQGCTGFDASANPTTVACPAVEVVFTGPFTQGEDVSLSVPEPSVFLMLLAGLPLALLLVLKKRVAVVPA
jgi:hypothetical protein